MTQQEFSDILDELDLSLGELALLLRVDIRVVRRWAREPEKITGIGNQMILAFRKLSKLGMAWKPEEIEAHPNPDALQRQIKLYMNDMRKRNRYEES